jgi:hypothetical protein
VIAYILVHMKMTDRTLRNKQSHSALPVLSACDPIVAGLTRSGEGAMSSCINITAGFP